jgi:magnesium transporter
LQREPRVCLSQSSQVYFRDIYNNLSQIIDLLETYREFAMGIAETYMSSVANRMNEIMKTLTIITTIFVPLTFLAGVYGMNMKWIPENDLEWAYPVFWAFCLAMAGAMLYWFRRRGWF